MQRVPFIAEGAIVPTSCNLQDVRLILRLAVARLAFRPSAKAGALVVFARRAQVAIIIPTLRTHADRPIGVHRRTTWSVVYHEVHTRARQPHELEGHEVDTRCNAWAGSAQFRSRPLGSLADFSLVLAVVAAFAVHAMSNVSSSSAASRRARTRTAGTADAPHTL